MTTWALPPKAKIYEALTAVADRRVKLLSENVAEVTSSSNDKVYTIQWTANCQGMTANDNASYWQGYMGYPMIAVLMLLGKITYSDSIARSLAGIHWKKLNLKHRNNYDLAITTVLNDLRSNGVNTEEIVQYIDDVYLELRDTNIEALPRGKKPPRPA